MQSVSTTAHEPFVYIDIVIQIGEHLSVSGQIIWAPYTTTQIYIASFGIYYCKKFYVQQLQNVDEATFILSTSKEFVFHYKIH